MTINIARKGVIGVVAFWLVMCLMWWMAMHPRVGLAFAGLVVFGMLSAQVYWWCSGDWS